MPLPIFLLGSETQFWKWSTFHESTLRACLPWPSQSWLAGLQFHGSTGTTTHNQRIPRFLQSMRPHTVQYGVPPAATSALHILSGLMKAICRDWFTHSSAIRRGFKRWIKMKMREENEHLITKVADVLTFASQRMSELPGWEWLRVAIYGQGCRGTLCFVCQLWAAGSNWRQFDDFPFDTVGCKRFRLLKRLFEGSRAYRLEFLHSFDCKTLPVSTLELFSSFNS